MSTATMEPTAPAEVDAREAYRQLVADVAQGGKPKAGLVHEVCLQAAVELTKFHTDVSTVKQRLAAKDQEAEAEALAQQVQAAKTDLDEASARLVVAKKEAERIVKEADAAYQAVYIRKRNLQIDQDRLRRQATDLLFATADPALEVRTNEISKELLRTRNDLNRTDGLYAGNPNAKNESCKRELESKIRELEREKAELAARRFDPIAGARLAV